MFGKRQVVAVFVIAFHYPQICYQTLYILPSSDKYLYTIKIIYNVNIIINTFTFMHLSNQGAANFDSPSNFLRSVNYITTRCVQLPSFDLNSGHNVFTNWQFIRLADYHLLHRSGQVI